MFESTEKDDFWHAKDLEKLEKVFLIFQVSGFREERREASCRDDLEYAISNLEKLQSERKVDLTRAIEHVAERLGEFLDRDARREKIEKASPQKSLSEVQVSDAQLRDIFSSLLS